MYKIFHGFALVEAYQNLKKAKRLAENKSVSRFVKPGNSHCCISCIMVSAYRNLRGGGADCY